MIDKKKGFFFTVLLCIHFSPRNGWWNLARAPGRLNGWSYFSSFFIIHFLVCLLYWKLKKFCKLFFSILWFYSPQLVGESPWHLLLWIVNSTRWTQHSLSLIKVKLWVKQKKTQKKNLPRTLFEWWRSWCLNCAGFHISRWWHNRVIAPI